MEGLSLCHVMTDLKSTQLYIYDSKASLVAFVTGMLSCVVLYVYNPVMALFFCLGDMHAIVRLDFLAEPDVESGKLLDDEDRRGFQHLTTDRFGRPRCLRGENSVENHCPRGSWRPNDVPFRAGHIDVVRELLGRAGIKVNQPAHDGRTPLHSACRHPR